MNDEYTYIPDIDYECRIAAFTRYASSILAKHGFILDESYPHSGLCVRYIRPDKKWAVSVTTSPCSVSVENHTPSGTGMPMVDDEPFIMDLMKDKLFRGGAIGTLSADFETPFEEVWLRLRHYFADEDIVSIFAYRERGYVQM